MPVLCIFLSLFFAGCISSDFSDGTSQTAITESIPEQISQEEKINPEDLINFDLPENQLLPENELLPEEEIFTSPLIYSAGTHTEKELYAFFCTHSKQNRSRAKKIAKLYIEECATEGINSDVAFIQMCHETNFLRFGNLVKKEWNNFCGLGAIDENQPGLRFKTMRLGVRAHIQHLHAYATTEDIVLKNECIDPRYKYVRPRAKATTVEGLSGTWAADKLYAEKIIKYLKELK
ncbi:MAG: glucosaminidase domain-containing protein [Treponema sp.]|nr:glucosaminidase domain-containing protein [Candidatus Treponema merdequi]